MDKLLKAVMHSHCNARLTVTFPAIRYHRPLTGTNLYCLVTEARVQTTCLRLLHDRRTTESRTHDRNLLIATRKSNVLIIAPPGGCAISELFGGSVELMSITGNGRNRGRRITHIIVVQRYMILSTSMFDKQRHNSESTSVDMNRMKS